MRKPLRSRLNCSQSEFQLDDKPEFPVCIPLWLPHAAVESFASANAGAAGSERRALIGPAFALNQVVPNLLSCQNGITEQLDTTCIMHS